MSVTPTSRATSPCTRAGACHKQGNPSGNGDNADHRRKRQSLLMIGGRVNGPNIDDRLVLRPNAFVLRELERERPGSGYSRGQRHREAGQDDSGQGQVSAHRAPFRSRTVARNDARGCPSLPRL